MELQAPTSNVKDLHEILKESGRYLGNLIGKDYQKFATKYNFALKDYLYAKLVNLSKVKMAFFSSQVVELDEIYVAQNIRWKDEIFTQEDFFDVLLNSKKMVVSATAGSGKSCFLKSMFINVIRNEQKLLPLFLELRKVNETSKSIFETLRSDIATYNKKFNEENLDYLLDRDGTIVFLDGFDEVNYDLKDDYLKEINALADRHPNLIILTSSRPEYNGFTDWSLYNVAYIEPLNLSQATEVIRNLKYDESIKERFTQALNSGLFIKHEGFSSNPLLLTIMLVTYEQFGDIPDKVHIFYDLAYQALFNKHDVTKENFHRKSLTNLDMYELRNVFSLFCLATYHKQNFEISGEDLNSLLTKSLNYFSHDVKYENLKTELLNNVPLLMRDGLGYCFTHRSFQEYFTAYHLTNRNVKEQVMNKVGERYRSDNVISMMFNMNREVLENIWILPRINKILDAVPSKFETVDERIRLLAVFFESIQTIDMNTLGSSEDNSLNLGYNFTQNTSFIYFLVEKYEIQDFHQELNDQYHSNDYSYEEIDFFELVLTNRSGHYIDIDNLNTTEKELVCRMSGDRYGKICFELINHIKDLVLARRNTSENTIDSMIFD